MAYDCPDVQVSLTRQPYIHLLDALFNSAVLPEHNWEDMGVMEQILALKRRTAIAEPLLEAAGELLLIDMLTSVFRIRPQTLSGIA